MKTKQIIRCVLASTCFISLALGPAVFGQGALTPPGAPSPTMKTLQQVEPRTPISALPFVITNAGSYYLTTNVIAIASNPGITIYTNNVTLDLSGFTVQGVPTAGTAVYMPNACTNVTVRNGAITGWANNGVYGLSVYNLVCERLTISGIANYGIYCGGGGTLQDCLVQNGTIGIYMTNGTVSACTVKSSSSVGISAWSSTVSACTVQSSGTEGIYANYSVVSGCNVSGWFYDIYAVHSSVSGCTVSGGSNGIEAEASSVSGCLVQGCFYSGIYIDYPGCQIIGNNCIGNNTSVSTYDAGILVNDNNNRIENNHVTGSGYAGIRLYGSYTGNIIIRNTVSGSGSNYITNSTSAFGPIITAVGTITNLNPWANFSY
jgi:parallel beta-helix repeat protein